MSRLYIDLNMVRARVVRHPREWRESGYHEIQSPPERYRIIDRDALCEVIGVGGERLAAVQNEWIDSSLAGGHLEPRKEWSEAVAVGRRSFVERMQEELGARARYRRVEDINDLSILRDGEEPYSPHLWGEIAALSAKSTVESANDLQRSDHAVVNSDYLMARHDLTSGMSAV